MTPTTFPQQTAVLAKNQPGYLPLPVFQANGITMSCWRLSFAERLRLLFTGRLWLHQMNYGMPLQPQLPSTKRLFD